MTPAARVQSAIEILDIILSGVPTEQALTHWARGNRFAGSKDRAAIRDYVFDAIRCRRSYAALGGSESGRGLILGGLRAKDLDAEALFDGSKYGPVALTPDEIAFSCELSNLATAQQLDLPDWVWDVFQKDLGADAFDAANALRDRADVFLRVNSIKCDVSEAQTRHKEEGIETEPHPLSTSALVVKTNARRVAQSAAYKEGLVELQDVASQAVCDFLNLPTHGRILDYCAGGGGKSLAMAAKTQAKIYAHDADFKRMSDLPSRAKRAGVTIQTVDNASINAPYDMVLCDVPCSGSGSWRRSPDGKWALSNDKLAALLQTQADILETASKLVAQGGELAYATCSLFTSENADQVAKFVNNNSAWRLIEDHQFLPQDGGDGFYVARLTRA